jgi:hypothetical protein
VLFSRAIADVDADRPWTESEECAWLSEIGCECAADRYETQASITRGPAIAGVLPRQQVTFLSDGGATVRELPAFLHPHSEHILDWFHIALRIKHLSRTARGFRGTGDCSMTKEKILKELELVKWLLWHVRIPLKVNADSTPS